MKTMAVLCLLAASTSVASAQSADRNQPAPPVAVCDARVTEYTVEVKGDPAPREPYHDRFNGPEPQRYYLESNGYNGLAGKAPRPEDYTGNEAEFLAHMENRKPPATTSPAKISFRATVKNTGDKAIRKLIFRLVLSHSLTGIKYPPYTKPVGVKIKPGEEAWFISTLSVRKAPRDLVRLMLSGQVYSDVQLLRIEFAGGSTWDRP